MRALLLLGTLSITGCGLGHLVHPDDPVRLGETDGLLALDLEAPGLVTLTLCRDGDYGACLTTGPMSTDRAVQLYQVPAGDYCLLNFLFEPHGAGSVETGWESERSRCIAVRAGVISDPGVYVVDARPIEGARWRIAANWTPRSDIGARIAAQYPDLAAMRITPTGEFPFRAR